MELSNPHKNQVSRFVTFFRQKRERLLSNCNGEQEDFKGDRLADTSAVYNSNDVLDLIDAFAAQVLGQLREEVDEIINHSAVYVTQLLSQAQQLGVELDAADIASISERNGAAQIAAMASSVTAPPVLARNAVQLPTLAAPTAPDLESLHKIQQLEADNQNLNQRYQQMQQEIHSLLAERSKLSADLESAHANFHQVQVQMHQMNPGSHNTVNVAEVERTLQETRGLLHAKQGECDQMRSELGQRLGDSSQFKELKAIVKKKTDEVKELRQRLVAAGLPIHSASAGGVELQAEDD